MTTCFLRAFGGPNVTFGIKTNIIPWGGSTKNIWGGSKKNIWGGSKKNV